MDNQNYLYWLYPISFLIAIISVKNKRDYKVYISILSLYLFASIVGSLIGNHFFDIDANIEPRLLPILYHIVMLFLLLIPFRSFDRYQKIEMPPVNSNLLMPFTYVIIIFSLIGIYGDIQNININAIMNDIVSVRNEMMENEQAVSFTDHFSFFCKHYGCVSLALAYYYMKYSPQKKFLIIILLFCSLSSVFAGLQNGGREYLIKYLFIFLLFYYYAKDDVSDRWKEINKKSIIALSVILGAIFIAISVVRFSNFGQYDANVTLGLLSYFGQGFANFSAIYNHFPDGVAGGAMHFPFFVGHGFSNNNLNQIISSSLSLNTFSTTIGSWVFDSGIYATVFIVLIYQAIMRYVGKRQFNLFTMIYILWFYEFIFSCLFFHNQAFSAARLLSFVAIIVVERMMKLKSQN